MERYRALSVVWQNLKQWSMVVDREQVWHRGLIKTHVAKMFRALARFGNFCKFVNLLSAVPPKVRTSSQGLLRSDVDR